MTPTRWEQARRDWPGFQGRDLWLGATGAAIAVGVLLIGGYTDEAIETALIGGLAGVLAALLLPVAMLGWAWHKAPMRLVTSIGERASSAETARDAALARPVEADHGEQLALRLGAMYDAVALDKQHHFDGERAAGRGPNREVFAPHFPEVTKRVDEWNELLAELRLTGLVKLRSEVKLLAPRCGIDSERFDVDWLAELVCRLVIESSDYMSKLRDLPLEYRLEDDGCVIKLEISNVGVLPLEPQDQLCARVDSAYSAIRDFAQAASKCPSLGELKAGEQRRKEMRYELADYLEVERQVRSWPTSLCCAVCAKNLGQPVRA